MRRWLPRPFLSLVLLLAWLLVTNSIAPGQILLGLVAGLLIPLFTDRFCPDRPRLRHPQRLLGYLAMVLFDILVANLVVARLILGPRGRLRSEFVEVPLALSDPLAVTLLASTVSLTPGTVSADLSADRRTLLVHGLHVTDATALVAHIKHRYERPLLEIFPC